jgi:hypothetical protein
MAIRFDPSRWQEALQTYGRWWSGRLDRPVVRVYLTGCDAGRDAPDIRAPGRTAQFPESVTPEQIVDVWDWQLSTREYLGDAVPIAWPDFGPGMLAVPAGAQPEVDRNTVWFHAPGEIAIEDLQIRLDLEHRWVRRIEEIYRAGLARWNGLVQMSMTDLGGSLDVISTFRPGERLLLDLVDAPDHVERVNWQVHEAWWTLYDHFNRILQPVNPGYSAWAEILSPTPSYMLQCDFCYMISPAMFDRFVKPELAASCRRLDNAFYHLDGPGQLAHLDSLLEIEQLDGVQWVPGDGQKPCQDWPEVYEKILSAGKVAQFIGSCEGALELIDRLGTGKGLLITGSYPVDRRDEADELVARLIDS